MRFEGFQLVGETKIDNLIRKRDFSNIYHQQAVNLNDSDKNTDFVLGEKNNYHQTSNAYLQFELTLKMNGGLFKDDNTDTIRLAKQSFPHLFEKATNVNTGVSEKGQSKYVALVCTIMRVCEFWRVKTEIFHHSWIKRMIY